MRGRHRDGPDRILFDASPLRIGSFRCYPWQTPFEDTGPISGFLLVFPRVPVIIHHAGREPVLADATRVMFYNRGQEYRRRAVGGRGDECEWFAFDPALVADAIRTFDPHVDDRKDRPFSFIHGPSDARTYLLQRRVVEHVTRAHRSDPLFVEEAMLCLLGRSVAAAFGARRPAAIARRARTRREHVDLADACRVLLSARLSEPLPLRDVARAVRASPYHVARVFQRQTGTTLHAYRQASRLLASLEYVAEPGADLARVAVDLGFAHHSHFTHAFRRMFGVPPSVFRRELDGRRLREASKIVTAGPRRGSLSSGA